MAAPSEFPPVVVITHEHMAAFRKEEAAKPKDPNAVISPFGDESVQGYPTDEASKRNGVMEIKEVVNILSAASISCCIVAENALIYYGTNRIMHDWHACVPTEQLDTAAALLRDKPDRFEPFRRSALSYPGRIDHHYPRFKFVGLRLFFILMPSEACHLEVKSENIEFSPIGLPYPTLPVYAQSLLDGGNRVDFDDLIDGMNLTLEWGEENLLLEGTVDADWIWWKYNVAHGRNLNNVEGVKPPWYSNPDKRRDIWAKQTSPQAKKARQTWKYEPDRETRFRKAGSKDPRLQRPWHRLRPRLAFQQRGHTVFAGVRNPQKAASLSSLPNVTIVTLDVTSPSSITAAVEIVRQHTGETLDVLINNAGQSVSTPLLDADLNTGRQLFEVNFWGALALVQAFGPMLVRAKGVVVNISSLGAVVNTPYLGLYGSSKAALTIAGETLRLEMRPLGVKTVTVMTGMVRTKFHDNIPAVVLPEGSFYRSVEERVRATTTVEGEMVKWQMPAEKFAEEIVNHVLNGVEGYVYKGGMSAVLRWSSELNELTSLQDRGLSQGAGLGVLAAAFQER